MHARDGRLSHFINNIHHTMPTTTRTTPAREKRATRASTGASGANTRNASNAVYDGTLSEDEEAESGDESDESEYGGLWSFDCELCYSNLTRSAKGRKKSMKQSSRKKAKTTIASEPRKGASALNLLPEMPLDIIYEVDNASSTTKRELTVAARFSLISQPPI
jgi:hypothetical protein